jgi:hypothetical protein
MIEQDSKVPQEIKENLRATRHCRICPYLLGSKVPEAL